VTIAANTIVVGAIVDRFFPATNKITTSEKYKLSDGNLSSK
jgi:hypothetical protein